MNDTQEQAVTATAGGAEERLVYLKLAALFPTLQNPRILDPDDPKTRELAESIKATKGLLHPVIVRPLPAGPVQVCVHPRENGKPAFHVEKGGFWLTDALESKEAKTKAAELAGVEYELLAGFRRYMAHRILAAEPAWPIDGEPGTIRAIVKDVDDKAALEITVIENLQRSELTPMEEAAGVRKLIGQGHTLEQIAAEIGKSAAWVCRRAKLTDLTEGWIKLAAKIARETGREPPAAVLEMISALPVNAQDEMIGHYRSEYSWSNLNMSNIRQQIANRMHTLRGAGWMPGDDPTLIPAVGACADCKKRSGVEPLLFDEDPEKVTDKNDRCLDHACWKAKAKAWVERRLVKAEAEHPGLLKVYRGDYDSDLDGQHVPRVGVNSWDPVRIAKKNTPGAQSAIAVAGPGAGELVYVVSRAQESGSRKVRPKGADGKPVPPKPHERQLGLHQKRCAWMVKTFTDKEVMGVMEENFGRMTHSNVLNILLAFGMSHNTASHGYYGGESRSAAWKDYEKHGGEKGPDNDALKSCFAEYIEPVFKGRCNFIGLDAAEKAYIEACRLCRLFGFSLFATQHEACMKALPVPKSWGAIPDPWATAPGDLVEDPYDPKHEQARSFKAPAPVADVKTPAKKTAKKPAAAKPKAKGKVKEAA